MAGGTFRLVPMARISHNDREPVSSTPVGFVSQERPGSRSARRWLSKARVTLAKVAIIGAGGYVFPLRLIGDILSHPELQDCTLSLMDVDPGRLERTADAARTLVASHKLPDMCRGNDGATTGARWRRLCHRDIPDRGVGGVSPRRRDSSPLRCRSNRWRHPRTRRRFSLSPLGPGLSRHRRRSPRAVFTGAPAQLCQSDVHDCWYLDRLGALPSVSATASRRLPG